MEFSGHVNIDWSEAVSLKNWDRFFRFFGRSDLASLGMVIISVGEQIEIFIIVTFFFFVTSRPFFQTDMLR